MLQFVLNAQMLSIQLQSKKFRQSLLCDDILRIGNLDDYFPCQMLTLK